MDHVSDQLAALEATVAYVKAGRKYQSLDSVALTSRYITAVEVAVAVPTLETIQFLDDLVAEFELRGVQAPNWVFAAHHIDLAALRERVKTNGLGRIGAPR